MARDRKLPREVVSRALAATRPPTAEEKPRAPKPTRPATPQEKSKARVIAHLRRLHPMD